MLCTPLSIFAWMSLLAESKPQYTPVILRQEKTKLAQWWADNLDGTE